MVKVKNKNRAWFISRDGRAPTYFYVMFSREKSGFSEIDFKLGRPVNPGDKQTIYYNVEPTKYGTEEYIKKWDFLPNSANVLLVNEKALHLLEKEAPGEFQAISTEIILPNGKSIEEFKLINITNRLGALNKDKSVPEDARYRSDVNQYKLHYYDRHALKNFNLCRVDEG